MSKMRYSGSATDGIENAEEREESDEVDDEDEGEEQEDSLVDSSEEEEDAGAKRLMFLELAVIESICYIKCI